MKMLLFALKMQIWEYYRNKVLRYLLLFGVLLIFFLLFYFITAPGGFGNPLIPGNFQDVLTGTTPLTNLLLFALFAILSFEYTLQVFKKGSLGVLSLRKKAFRLVAAAQNCVTLAISLIVLFVMELGVSICCHLAGLTSSETLNVLSYILTYSGITIIVAPILGFVLACCFRRTTGYSIMLLFLLFLSPLRDGLLQPIQNTLWNAKSLPILTLVQHILIEPFNIASPAERVTFDFVYLIPAEPYQILIALVWLVPLLASGAFIVYRKRRLVVPVFAVSFIALSLLWAAGSNSLSLPRWTFAPNVNDISDGSFAYFDKRETISGMTANIPTVERYKMQFCVRNRLNAKVAMKLAEPIADCPYFTLYRGYRVKNVTDEYGHTLKFKQEDDFITVTPVDDKAKELLITYAGTGNGNYSNNQGIFLLGAFPYYPWPGKQLYRVDRSSNPRRGEVRRIEVKVDAPFDEVLTPQGQNVANLKAYAAVSSSSLTLMAGQLGQSGDKSTYQVYAAKRELESSVVELDDQGWAAALKRSYDYRRKLGLSDEELSDMFSIVLLPTFPGYSNLYTIPVYQDNYVLIPGMSGFDKNQVSALLALRGLEKNARTNVVFGALFAYLCDPESYNPEDYPKGAVPPELMITAAVRKQGEKAVLKKIGGFLASKDSTMTGERFLKSLGGK